MGETNETDLSADDIYDEMEAFEPYTAKELASYFDASIERIRKLLQRLFESEKIRKKELEPQKAIWIRKGPIHKCEHCGHKYEIKFLHPVLSGIQFCPQCGKQV